MQAAISSGVVVEAEVNWMKENKNILRTNRTWDIDREVVSWEREKKENYRDIRFIWVGGERGWA
jgi:hypothetical protein